MVINSKLKDAALVEYLEESTEMVDRFSAGIAKFEADPGNKEILAAIYRDMHTLKGSSHLFGFSQIAELAHTIETCLDPIRKGLAGAPPALVDILYGAADVIQSLIGGVRETRAEPDQRDRIHLLIGRIVALSERERDDLLPKVQGLKSEPPKEPLSKKPVEPSAPPPPKREAEVKALTRPAKEENPGFGFFDDDDGGPVVGAPKSKNPTESAASQNRPTESKETPPSEAKAVEGGSTKAAADDTQSETIRVHVSLLDNLMNLIGEQVLIRNQILQHAKINDSDTELTKLSQRLNIITAELQKEVMKTRMQPIGNVLHKFHRMVRDLSKDLEKKVELDLVGVETELDKTIIEAVKDPLTHMVRNALDHGVESAAERKLAGKPETARIQIRAYHESGQVIIEVSDDGKGMDRNRIGAKAVERGLVSNDALSRMSEREIYNLAFAPGFSTATNVSAVSGRGVGMDVVKTNVERIGGVVDLQSMPGSGTTISLRIPLTLAIVPALVVQAKGQRFAIPRSKLVELVLIEESDNAQVRIETLQGSPVLRLRGKVLSLLSLSDVLQKPGTQERRDLEKSKDPINVVVVNADGHHYGLVIDGVEDTADVVVKALPSFLKDLVHFSGATIMGDGSVALTIDVVGVAAASRNGAEMEPLTRVESEIELATTKSTGDEMVEFLLVDVGVAGSYAIPLTLVSRLEEFSADQFELSGEQRVVRYRNSLLPIFSLPEFLNLPRSGEQKVKTKFPVIVIRRGDYSYGVEVEAIQDVVSMAARIDKSIRDRAGILGTIVAGDQVVVIVDILGMIDSVKTRLINDGGSHDGPDAGSSRTGVMAKRRNHRILLAEDSAFFRSYVRQLLEEAGFQTDTAMDGAEAWMKLDTSSQGHFTMVLSDIEMPNLDGLGLAKKVSSDPRFKGIPLVAITSRYSNADVEKGRAVGFWQYLEKLKADELLTELDNILIKQSQQSQTNKEVKRAAGN